jgi:hypothetical protein
MHERSVIDQPAGVLVAQDLKRSGRCARGAQGPSDEPT